MLISIDRYLDPLKSFLLHQKHEVRSYLGKYPDLYFPLIHLLRRELRFVAVNDRTEVVIEGFGRSANTYAVAAFILAQPYPHSVQVAHHIHLPAQIVSASRRNIPAIVLIREPLEATLSSLASFYPYLPLECVLESYIQFYKHVEPYRDNYIIAEFKEVTENFGFVIERLNRKFGTEFSTLIPSQEDIRSCISKKNVLPSPNRDAAKNYLREQPLSERSQSLLSQARDLYDRFLVYQRESCL